MKKKDVIVFQSPIQKNFLLVKRIVGTSHDIVKIYSNNNIIINNQKDNSLSNIESDAWIQNEWSLNDNEYIVLGDNLEKSQDSRSFGPISSNLIIGKVILKLKPLQRIK